MGFFCGIQQCLHLLGGFHIGLLLVFVYFVFFFWDW